MIKKFYRSIVTMSSRDLVINISMLLCIFILKKTEVESAASGLIKLISPRDVNVFLQEGDQLNIEFRAAVQSFLYRYVDGRRTRMDVKDYTYQTSPDRRYHYLRIQKTAITSDDAGQYICVTQDRGDGDSEEKSVRVQIAKTTATDGDLNKEFEDVTIKCDMSGITSYRIVWERNGKELVEGERYVRIDAEKSLKIVKAGRGDVGEYKCTFVPDPVTSGAGSVSATPFVRSKPFVDPFHGSVSPLQGDEVTINCKVYGSPMPDVSWTKDGKALSNNSKTEYGTYGKIENARLTIRELEASDRANYGCVATTTDGKNSTSQEILVRVKDRYAALWPFIGICIEVVILIVIIFIYEKRKTKATDDESDSGGKTNSHDQRSGDVRQRNTVRT